MDLFRSQQFKPVGLTPPKGRLGHSVPTPRPLEERPIFSNEETTLDNSTVRKPQLKLEILPPVVSEAGPNTTWNRRESTGKPPLSPLDQIRPLSYDVNIRETLEEAEEEQLEEDGGTVEDVTSAMVAMDLAKRLSSMSCEQSSVNELDKFKGDSLLSVSYKPSLVSPGPPTTNWDDLGGSFVSAFAHSLNSSLNLPFVTSPTKDKETFLYPTVARNPNKALLTIDAKSSLILVTNEVACNLFGYQKSDMVGLKIQHLFTEPYQSHQRALAEENIDSTGGTVLVSGKVMEAVTSYGLVFPVSVWMKKVISCSPDPRVIIVIEPVERCSIGFVIDDVGHVVSCESGFSSLFGHSDSSCIINSPISSLIPSLVISEPQSFNKEVSLTGRTKDGSAFPLEVTITGSSVESLTRLSDNEHTSTSLDSSTDPPSITLLHGKVTVYASLSGMVCLDKDGSIVGCNHHFALMLFGYSQEELLNKDITLIMPNFHSQLSNIIEEAEEESESESSIPPVHPLFIHEAYESEVQPIVQPKESKGGLECTRNSSKGAEDLFYSVSERSVSLDYGLDSHLASISEEGGGSDVFLPDTLSPDPPLSTNTESLPSSTDIKCSSSVLISSDSDGANTESNEVLITVMPNMVSMGDTSFEYNHPNSVSSSEGEADVNNTTDQVPDKDEVNTEDPPLLLSSTPCRILSRPNSRLSSAPSRAGGYPEGTYLGTIRHKDSTLMSVVFELKQISLRNDQSLYCIWLSRQLEYSGSALVHEAADDGSSTLDSLNNSSDAAATSYHLHKTISDPFMASSGISGAQEEAIATEGKYTDAYETLGPIGRGAFGFVKLARRIEDSLLVVVKFIKKAAVISENWVNDETMGLVPREICLLARLNHPNIVQLLEAYENENYFQLVMEKHGDGMDLFSFIERGPSLDEHLISYLFRQIVAGLVYLHDRNILHRDVKDENIILDHTFHVKIIDFGSAVLMEEGKLFNTFCGTLEYCSPEVLLGNSYPGPQLEMWSLGVTLYTIVYSENPFFDVEEIISGRLQPPYFVSPGLMKIILWLLHPDPTSRATLHDLEKDKWVNQPIVLSQYSFDSIMTEGKKKSMLNTSAEEPNFLNTKVPLNRSLS